MKLKTVFGVVMALSVSAGVSSAVQLITFDDLPPSDGAQLNNGYAGFDWDNFYYLTGTELGIPSGYINGTVSQPNVAYNGFGEQASFSSANQFNLTSADIAGAWDNGLRIEVQGYDGATLEYDNTYTVNTTGPSLITFDYTGITSVNFISSGGTAAGYVGSGTQFAIDNILINGAVAAPESAPDAGTTGLMLGAVFLGIDRLRKRIS